MEEKRIWKRLFLPSIKKMSRFANYFSENEIRAHVVPQIPWGTLFVYYLLESKHSIHTLRHIFIL